MELYTFSMAHLVYGSSRTGCTDDVVALTNTADVAICPVTIVYWRQRKLPRYNLCRSAGRVLVPACFEWTRLCEAEAVANRYR